MNKKALYESIMSAVAKEVKKALMENDNVYSDYHEAELAAIHYEQIPDNLKTITQADEEWVLAEKMTREQVVNFAASVDWSLLAEEYHHFYPTASSYYEEYIYDTDITMDGGTIYALIPCSDVVLEVGVDFDWYYNPYDPGDYYQPPEGGYGELDTFTITDITIVINGKERIELTKDEIKSYRLEDIFSDEISEIANNLDQGDYFVNDNSDLYDQWKDEQWERGID